MIQTVESKNLFRQALFARYKPPEHTRIRESSTTELIR